MNRRRIVRLVVLCALLGVCAACAEELESSIWFTVDGEPRPLDSVEASQDLTSECQFFSRGQAFGWSIDIDVQPSEPSISVIYSTPSFGPVPHVETLELTTVPDAERGVLEVDFVVETALFGRSTVAGRATWSHLDQGAFGPRCLAE